MIVILHNITAASWFTPVHHGQWAASTDAQAAEQSCGEKSWCKPSPDLTSPEAAVKVIGKSVRYFQRMPAEARYSLCAASMALNASSPACTPDEIGLLAGRFEGCQAADLAYYQDYLASGRTLARGNMFVYTLPTSVLGAVSVVFELKGPSFYLQEDHQPLSFLVHHAENLIANKQAKAMLVLWSDEHAAVCLAVSEGDAWVDTPSPAQQKVMAIQLTLNRLLLDDEQGQPITPLQLADQLQQALTQASGS